MRTLTLNPIQSICCKKIAFRIVPCEQPLKVVNTLQQKECIPVGCILPAAVAVGGGGGGHGLHQASQVAFLCGGLLLWPSGVWPSVMVFWCGAFWCGGLLLWPSGCGGLLVWCLLVWWPSVMALWPPEDHTRRPPSIRRPPNQKAITEGHNRRPQ